MEIEIKKKLGAFRLQVYFKSSSRRIGILGASGCGKSVTLRSIAGMERPDSGRILVDGRVMFDSERHIDIKPQKRSIGYLFQNYALFPTMTVAENIEAGIKGTNGQKKERAVQMMERFQLTELRDRLPGQLSGGQQQRTALARIMAYEPDMILLDEPFFCPGRQPEGTAAAGAVGASFRLSGDRDPGIPQQGRDLPILP